MKTEHNNLDLSEAGIAVQHMVETLGWDKFHSTRNIAIAITVEASELLAKLQWRTDQEIDTFLTKPTARQEIADEVADIVINVLSLCARLGLDLNGVTTDKCHRIVQRFASREGISVGASRNDLQCQACGANVVAEWHYCSRCGNALLSIPNEPCVTT